MLKSRPYYYFFIKFLNKIKRKKSIRSTKLDLSPIDYLHFIGSKYSYRIYEYFKINNITLIIYEFQRICSIINTTFKNKMCKDISIKFYKTIVTRESIMS